MLITGEREKRDSLVPSVPSYYIFFFDLFFFEQASDRSKLVTHSTHTHDRALVRSHSPRLIRLPSRRTQYKIDQNAGSIKYMDKQGVFAREPWLIEKFISAYSVHCYQLRHENKGIHSLDACRTR